MQATEAIRTRRLPPPPPLTEALLEAWRALVATQGRELVAVGKPNRYANQWNSPPLLWHLHSLAEIVDDYDEVAGKAELGAEFFGEWYRVVDPAAPRSDLVYLTWLYEGGTWRLAPHAQHLA